jgi:hypothetical protein
MSTHREPALVLVCGSRGWADRTAIERRLRRLAPGTVVLHGGARGADRLAGTVATELGLQVEVMPAQWDRYRRAAGPRRNLAMLARRPDLVIAFVTPSLAASAGTRHTVTAARARGIPVEIHEPADAHRPGRP